MYVGVSPFPAVLLCGVTRIILVYLLFFFLFLFSLIRSSFRFLNASSDHLPKLRQIPYITVPIRSLSRRFPTAERLPELRQFPICPVLGLLTNACFGFLVSLHFLATFKCLPHYGKESSLFVPSFLLLPLPAASLVSYPYDCLPNTSATSISSSVFSPFL